VPRILLIDDDATIRRMLRVVLEREGHEVREASNGRDALRLERESPADLVITDIFMPEMDGVELILALRRHAPNLKVIAMSGGGDTKQTEVLDVAQPFGAFASIHKPFALDEMLTIVGRALSAEADAEGDSS
jgi:DNA-binding NtrC family response regulator